MRDLKGRLLYVTILMLSFLAVSRQAFAQEHQDIKNGPEEKFNAKEYIMDHVLDSHEWHLWTNPKSGHHVTVSLPVIIYDRESGLHLFSSKNITEGKTYEDYKIAAEGKYEGRIVKVNDAGEVNEEYVPLDLSITKSVAGMMVAALVLLWIFLSLAHSYKKSGISAPKGLQGLIEPVILFVRDDVIKPNIGPKYEKFMPYLLTVFFFILINNILGLIPIFPFGANVTGNIAVTLVLAVCTLVITEFNGSKTYWKHIVASPGVPFWLLPIMFIVEVIGIFSKPFALMIRLFANITAGHIIVLSLIGLIFIFKTAWASLVSVPFVVFMDCLELFVAFLQAYVFTLLSSLFIGLALQEEHH
jgi:F-type H+-transporting ATPase subunit a